MADKQFATCFDKDCEQFAEILMTLVSNDDRICNIKTSREEFKKDRSIVSREYVLTIGEKSSAVQRANFPDKYNAYGIHIGFYGHKGWISCDNVYLSSEEAHKFLEDMKELLVKSNMETSLLAQKVDEVKSLLNKETQIRQKATEDNGKSSIIELLNPISYLKTIREVSMFWGYVAKDWFIDSQRRKELLYIYAVVYFYHKYLKEFLDIKEQQPTEQNF